MLFSKNWVSVVIVVTASYKKVSKPVLGSVVALQKPGNKRKVNKAVAKKPSTTV